MSQEREQNATWANVGERVADLCIEAEAICSGIAESDLGETPLYIVPQSRITGILGGPADCLGFTSPSLDLYLRNDIGWAWRGRGACMVINDLRYADQPLDDVELDFFAIALHELAHILERPMLFQERADVEPAKLLFESIVLAAYVQDSPVDGMPERTPLKDHDDRFIRAVLHLRHRADVLGVEVAPALVCPTRDLGLSHANAYRDALGDEPIQLFESSIRQILASPPPEEFSRLWADDLAHLSQHPISHQE